METTAKKPLDRSNRCLLQSEKLQKYILETSVYPRELEPLKELRDASASHPRAFLGTTPDAGQLITLLLKMLNPIKTIEIGVFTGYSLLLTALSTPNDAKITAIDIDRNAYEIGLPFIEKADVAHKINFIESQALPVLDQLLEDKANEGSFEFAFVDADKENYWNYHERLMKLVKIGGMIINDNILWGGSVAWSEEEIPDSHVHSRNAVLEFNKKIAADPHVEIVFCPVGDGVSICRRLY